MRCDSDGEQTKKENGKGGTRGANSDDDRITTNDCTRACASLATDRSDERTQLLGNLKPSAAGRRAARIARRVRRAAPRFVLDCPVARPLGSANHPVEDHEDEEDEEHEVAHVVAPARGDELGDLAHRRGHEVARRVLHARGRAGARGTPSHTRHGRRRWTSDRRAYKRWNERSERIASSISRRELHRRLFRYPCVTMSSSIVSSILFCDFASLWMEMVSSLRTPTYAKTSGQRISIAGTFSPTGSSSHAQTPSKLTSPTFTRSHTHAPGR